jgi:hypothetical protein
VSRTMRCVPIVALRAEVRRPCFDSAGARQSARSFAGPPCIPTRSGEARNFGRNDRGAPSVIRINGRPDRRRDGGRARKNSEAGPHGCRLLRGKQTNIERHEKISHPTDSGDSLSAEPLPPAGPNASGPAALPSRSTRQQRAAARKRTHDAGHRFRRYGGRLPGLPGRCGPGHRPSRRDLSGRRLRGRLFRPRRDTGRPVAERAGYHGRRAALPDAERTSRHSGRRRAGGHTNGPGKGAAVACRSAPRRHHGLLGRRTSGSGRIDPIHGNGRPARLHGTDVRRYLARREDDRPRDDGQPVRSRRAGGFRALLLREGSDSPDATRLHRHERRRRQRAARQQHLLLHGAEKARRPGRAARLPPRQARMGLEPVVQIS